MIGILIVTHGSLGDALISGASHVLGKPLEQVRALRDRWNMLCAADPDADPELRARFDRAVDKAWAPCAAWYAALRQTQDDNLAGRAALCDALDAELTALGKDIQAYPPQIFQIKRKLNVGGR